MSERLLKFVRNDDLDNVRLLVERGSPINKMVIDAAFIYINHNMIKYLLKKNNDIDLKSYALFISTGNDKNIDLTKYLIKIGADIHYRDDKPLIHSIKNKKIKTIRYLIMKGANIHAKNDVAIRTAINQNQKGIVKYLLQEGADIKVLSEEDQIKYKYYCSEKIMIFLLDFHYKRELEFSKNKIADINVLSIVFGFH